MGRAGPGSDTRGALDKKGERRNCSLEKGICLWSIGGGV